MSVDLLIDGYNLLHFAGLARARYAPGDLERSRERLLKRIRNGLTENERARTTIVFDARDAQHADRRESRPHGMLVLYSPLGREADDTIEELIDAHTAPRQLLVVSSDNRLKRAARSSRALWMDSDSFLVDLDRRTTLLANANPEQAEAVPPSSRTQSPAKAEQDFLRQFGEIDVAALQREVNEEFRQAAAPVPVNPPPASTRPTKSDKQSFAAPRSPTSRPGGEKSHAGPTSHEQSLPEREVFSLEDEDSVQMLELNFWQQRVNELKDEAANVRRQKPSRDAQGDQER